MDACHGYMSHVVGACRGCMDVWMYVVDTCRGMHVVGACRGIHVVDACRGIHVVDACLGCMSWDTCRGIHVLDNGARTPAHHGLGHNASTVPPRVKNERGPVSRVDYEPNRMMFINNTKQNYKTNDV